MNKSRYSKYNKNTGDPIYGNQLVQLIVNNLMKKGKKKLAYRLCYQNNASNYASRKERSYRNL